MDSARFDEISERGFSMLRAAMTLPPQMLGGQVVTYNAWIDDTEVVVLGFQTSNDEGGIDTKPISILVDETLFHRLRVDGEGARIVDGVLRPPKVRKP